MQDIVTDYKQHSSYTGHNGMRGSTDGPFPNAKVTTKN